MKYYETLWAVRTQAGLWRKWGGVGLKRKLTLRLLDTERRFSAMSRRDPGDRVVRVKAVYEVEE